MIDALAFLIGVGFWIYGLIDCARVEQEQVRNLPKWGWLLIIIFFGTLGAIAWFIFGRPKVSGSPRRPRSRVLPPDDNPEFLKKL